LQIDAKGPDRVRCRKVEEDGLLRGRVGDSRAPIFSASQRFEIAAFAGDLAAEIPHCHQRKL
jgi:hypothetical protein